MQRNKIRLAPSIRWCSKKRREGTTGYTDSETQEVTCIHNARGNAQIDRYCANACHAPQSNTFHTYCRWTLIILYVLVFTVFLFLSSVASSHTWLSYHIYTLITLKHNISTAYSIHCQPNNYTLWCYNFFTTNHIQKRSSLHNHDTHRFCLISTSYAFNGTTRWYCGDSLFCQTWCPFLRKNPRRRCCYLQQKMEKSQPPRWGSPTDLPRVARALEQALPLAPLHSLQLCAETAARVVSRTFFPWLPAPW